MSTCSSDLKGESNLRDVINYYAIKHQDVHFVCSLTETFESQIIGVLEPGKFLLGILFRCISFFRNATA